MTGETLDLAQVDLRLDPALLPFDAPPANEVTTWEGRDVLWLGPDEWLIVGAAGTETAIVRELEALLDGPHRSIVDVSANRIVFDLEDGREPLAAACGLDLHPSWWSPGMCAQTLFGRAQVILQQRDERTTRVFARPSFAGYVAALLDAAS
jgi:sarcosine oxidase subunit gamma